MIDKKIEGLTFPDYCVIRDFEITTFGPTIESFAEQISQRAEVGVGSLADIFENNYNAISAYINERFVSEETKTNIIKILNSAKKYWFRSETQEASHLIKALHDAILDQYPTNIKFQNIEFVDEEAEANNMAIGQIKEIRSKAAA
jgi:hypothetical protein